MAAERPSYNVLFILRDMAASAPLAGRSIATVIDRRYRRAAHKILCPPGPFLIKNVA
jgi:hypothetical protein